MKKVIITQSNYIPWKGYFDAINHVDEFVVYDDMQYTKRDWRNRNKIKTPNGPMWLSIPVEVSGKLEQKIMDTRVADANWGKQHWKTLVHNYKKAPFFNLYAAELEALYNDSISEFLSDINISFLRWVMQKLDVDTNIVKSSELSVEGTKSQRLLNICKAIGATDYFSGPSAKSYLEEQLFLDAGVNVHYFDFAGYPEYQQLYDSFAHDVSVLDVLFNCGREARNHVFKISSSPV